MVMAERRNRSNGDSKMDSFVKDWARWSVAERYTAIGVVAASLIGVATHLLLDVI